MPSRSLTLPMSIEAFRAMPHRLGWKHEYFDGTARLRPSPMAEVLFERPMTIRPKPIASASITYREALREDAPRLIELFVRAFDAGPEYCDVPDESYRLYAERNVDLGDGAVHVALVRTRLVGAIRFLPHDAVMEVAPLMVDPSVRRMGVASALLDAGLPRAIAAGGRSLRSRCLLANEASLEWHLSNGFTEVPTWSATTARLRHARAMVVHYRGQGDATKTAAARREAEALARLESELSR